MSDINASGRAKLGRAGLNGVALLAGAAAADALLTLLTVVSVAMGPRESGPVAPGAMLMNFVFAYPLCLLFLGFAVYFTRMRGLRTQLIGGAAWFGGLFLIFMLASVYLMSREYGDPLAKMAQVLGTPEVLLGTLAAASVGALGVLVTAKVRAAMQAKAG